MKETIKHKFYQPRRQKKILFVIITFFFLTNACDKSELSVPNSKNNLHFYFHNGEELLTKIKPTNDGGLVYVGESNLDGFILVIDANGKELFHKTIGGEGLERFHDVVQTEDGSFLVAGQTHSTSKGALNPNGDGYLVKFSASGDLIWEKRYGDTKENIFYGIAEGPNNEIGLAGSSFGFNLNTWAMKLTSSGDSIWSKTYQVGPFNDLAKAIIFNELGDLILLGMCSEENSATGYNKYNTFLKVLNRHVGGLVKEVIYTDLTRQNKLGSDINPYMTILPIPDGYIWGSYIEVEEKKGRIEIAKITESGQLIWEKQFSGLGNSWFANMNFAPDGGLMICGSSTNSELVSGLGFQNATGTMLKVSIDGNIEWETFFGSKDREQITAQAVFVNGGWLVGGVAKDNGDGVTKLYGYKTDEKGNFLIE